GRPQRFISPGNQSWLGHRQPVYSGRSSYESDRRPIDGQGSSTGVWFGRRANQESGTSRALIKTTSPALFSFSSPLLISVPLWAWSLRSSTPSAPPGHIQGRYRNR